MVFYHHLTRENENFALELFELHSLAIIHLARFPLSLSQAMLSSGLNGVTMGGKMPVRLTWCQSDILIIVVKMLTFGW